MQHTKGKGSSGIDEGRDEGRNTDRETEDQNLKEFFRVLGLTATVDVLKSIQEGESQYMDFAKFMSTGTISSRIRQLISLGIIKHHFGRERKRKEWYTLTKKGKRIVKAVIRLEKAFHDG
ncbi:MAG: winged helix-turn-helix transcriptional regulator [Theionarchaea archaeon]|nr:winged helix-turn-helix transcriptional regulator [Theionarchaea archaeon]